MIKNLDSDVRIDTGRCTGGSFIRVTHIPTGLSRYKGPLGNESGDELAKNFLSEIEEELATKGLDEYLVKS